MAKPSPFSRPALLRISDKERCPKTTATIEIGKKKKNSPQIKLTMAFPLVCTGASETGGASLADVAAEPETAARPQRRQNLSSAVKLFPQPAQNRGIYLPAARNVVSVSIGNLHETYYPRFLTSMR